MLLLPEADSDSVNNNERILKLISMRNFHFQSLVFLLTYMKRHKPPAAPRDHLRAPQSTPSEGAHQECTIGVARYNFSLS